MAEGSSFSSYTATLDHWFTPSTHSRSAQEAKLSRGSTLASRMDDTCAIYIETAHSMKKGSLPGLSVQLEPDKQDANVLSEPKGDLCMTINAIRSMSPQPDRSMHANMCPPNVSKSKVESLPVHKRFWDDFNCSYLEFPVSFVHVLGKIFRVNGCLQKQDSLSSRFC